MRTEASELRKLTTLILRALENAGLAQLSRDKQGNIKGLNITIKVHDTLHVQSVVKGKLTKKEEDEEGDD